MRSDDVNFDNLFNAISDFIFILDMEGNILDVNKAVPAKLGYDKSDVYGKSVLLVHPPEYREKAKEIVGDMLMGKRASCPLPLLAKNGNHIPVETTISFGKWNGNDVLIGVSRNLSDITLSEEKFYRVFDNNDAIMTISEIDTGTFLNVNKKFLKTFGYNREEVIGKNSKDLNLFRDYTQREIFSKRLDKEGSIESEYTIMLTKEGKPVHTLFSLSKIKIQTFSYLLISAIDISVLKETEAKLEKNITQQTLLADISQNIINLQGGRSVIDDSLKLLGQHTGVSRIYIFEYTTDYKFANCIYEWCNEGIIREIERLQNIPYSVIERLRQLLLKKGNILRANANEIPVELVSTFHLQPVNSFLVFPLLVQGKPFGFISFDECTKNRDWELQEVELLRTVSGILSNTFERLSYQKQLSESEMRLKLAIDNTEAGLWDWNIVTGEVFFSDIWLNMLGYNREEVEPHVQTWEKLVHPDDLPEVMEILNKHLKGETENYECTHRLLTKSGTWKWVLDKGKITERDSTGEPLRAIGTHIDVDNQKEIEQQLKALNSTKDKFFSIIAHDLRGPIGTLMHVSEMLSDEERFDEQTFKMFLNSQKELSQNTFQLLDNLLNWAMVNRDQIRYNPKLIDINTIIEESLANIKFRAAQKELNIIYNKDERVTAFADEDMVKLVIRNLLSNALKFTDHKGTIKIDFERGDSIAEIRITDTGVGISDENIEKILSENDFFSTTGTNSEKGTGLGLKVCKNFIAVNHGHFSINSILKKGTTFSFTLPAKN
jgi:PAS domain S-box-containing protein